MQTDRRQNHLSTWIKGQAAMLRDFNVCGRPKLQLLLHCSLSVRLYAGRHSTTVPCPRGVPYPWGSTTSHPRVLTGHLAGLRGNVPYLQGNMTEWVIYRTPLAHTAQLNKRVNKHTICSKRALLFANNKCLTS